MKLHNDKIGKIKHKILIEFTILIALIIVPVIAFIIEIDSPIQKRQKEIEIVMNDEKYDVNHTPEERLVDYYDNGISMNESGELFEINEERDIVVFTISPKLLNQPQESGFTVDESVISNKIIYLDLELENYEEDWIDNDMMNNTFNYDIDEWYSNEIIIDIDSDLEIINSTIVSETISSKYVNPNQDSNFVSRPLISYRIVGDAILTIDELSLVTINEFDH